MKLKSDSLSRDEAADSLTTQAKEHLATVHPDIVKTDEQVRGDITSMMVEESSPEEE